MTLQGSKRLKTSEGIDACDFSDVVDRACEGLKDRQIKNSIRRIQDMEVRLSGLERELDDFLLKKEGDLA